jgi:hypothetical protein
MREKLSKVVFVGVRSDLDDVEKSADSSKSIASTANNEAQ